MTLEEIKAAVDAGKTVHWGNEGYRVVKWSNGRYQIGWNIGGHNENYIGLTWTDDVTVNGKPEQFFIAE